MNADDKTNSPHELLDLVNDQDIIIGEVLKAEANSNPELIHREAAVFIYDDQKRLLFQQRSFRKQVRPGYWTTAAAGHVPKGMEPLQAAIKELSEELGFTSSLKFIKKEKLLFPRETHFVYCYFGSYLRGEIKIEPEEIEQAMFLSEEQFSDLLKEDTKWDELSLEMAKEFWQGKLAI